MTISRKKNSAGFSLIPVLIIVLVATLGLSYFLKNSLQNRSQIDANRTRRELAALTQDETDRTLKLIQVRLSCWVTDCTEAAFQSNTMAELLTLPNDGIRQKGDYTFKFLVTCAGEGKNNTPCDLNTEKAAYSNGAYRTLPKSFRILTQAEGAGNRVDVSRYVTAFPNEIRNYGAVILGADPTNPVTIGKGNYTGKFYFSYDQFAHDPAGNPISQVLNMQSGVVFSQQVTTTLPAANVNWDNTGAGYVVDKGVQYSATPLQASDLVAGATALRDAAQYKFTNNGYLSGTPPPPTTPTTTIIRGHPVTTLSASTSTTYIAMAFRLEVAGNNIKVMRVGRRSSSSIVGEPCLGLYIEGQDNHCTAPESTDVTVLDTIDRLKARNNGDILETQVSSIPMNTLTKATSLSFADDLPVILDTKNNHFTNNQPLTIYGKTFLALGSIYKDDHTITLVSPQGSVQMDKNFLMTTGSENTVTALSVAQGGTPIPTGTVTATFQASIVAPQGQGVTVDSRLLQQGQSSLGTIAYKGSMVTKDISTSGQKYATESVGFTSRTIEFDKDNLDPALSSEILALSDRTIKLQTLTNDMRINSNASQMAAAVNARGSDDESQQDFEWDDYETHENEQQ